MREFRQLSQSDRASEGWKQDLNSSQLSFELKVLNHSGFTHPSDTLMNCYHMFSPFFPSSPCFLCLGSLSWIFPICPAQLQALWRKHRKKMMHNPCVWFPSPLRSQDIYKGGIRKCWGRQEGFLTTLESPSHMERVHPCDTAGFSLPNPLERGGRTHSNWKAVKEKLGAQSQTPSFPVPLGSSAAPRRHLLCSAPLIQMVKGQALTYGTALSPVLPVMGLCWEFCWSNSRFLHSSGLHMPFRFFWLLNYFVTCWACRALLIGSMESPKRQCKATLEKWSLIPLSPQDKRLRFPVLWRVQRRKSLPQRT